MAAVLTENETRLYLNGKLVATAPGSEPGGDTPFVIGNVGETNLINFYNGEIRSVRISEGERYSGDHYEVDETDKAGGALFRLSASELPTALEQDWVRIDRFCFFVE